MWAILGNSGFRIAKGPRHKCSWHSSWTLVDGSTKVISWTHLLGHICLDAFAWTHLLGHACLYNYICLDTLTWTHLLGHICLNTPAWTATAAMLRTSRYTLRHQSGEICFFFQDFISDMLSQDFNSVGHVKPDTCITAETFLKLAEPWFFGILHLD